jgi:RecB family endonuclease NucS
MTSYVNLKQIGRGWEFASEAALGDFVWNNLKQLLGLTPLKRQYFVQGHVCDILAAHKYGLKNTEDRYIVQQLTRCYDALLAQKPFS